MAPPPLPHSSFLVPEIKDEMTVIKTEQNQTACFPLSHLFGTMPSSPLPTSSFLVLQVKGETTVTNQQTNQKTNKQIRNQIVHLPPLPFCFVLSVFPSEKDEMFIKFKKKKKKKSNCLSSPFPILFRVCVLSVIPARHRNRYSFC